MCGALPPTLEANKMASWSFYLWFVDSCCPKTWAPGKSKEPRVVDQMSSRAKALILVCGGLLGHLWWISLSLWWTT